MQLWHKQPRITVLGGWASCHGNAGGRLLGDGGGINPDVASSTSVGAASPGRPDWCGLTAGDANGVGEPTEPSSCTDRVSASGPGARAVDVFILFRAPIYSRGVCSFPSSASTTSSGSTAAAVHSPACWAEARGHPQGDPRAGSCPSTGSPTGSSSSY